MAAVVSDPHAAVVLFASQSPPRVEQFVPLQESSHSWTFPLMSNIAGCPGQFPEQVG